jgi:site-specific DNA recombinase
MRSIDRLSRDLLIYATVRNAIRKAGVKVYDFDGRTIEFDLGDDVKAVLGEEEKRAIGRRVKQARAGRVRNGLVAGGNAPYGYRWENKALVTVPGQAAIVGRIFADYASGMGQRAIVRTLNADGIPAPSGRDWQQSTISRILAQPLYVGRIKTEDGTVAAKHQPIIEPDLWERVEAIRNRRTVTPENGGRRRGKTAGRQPDSKHLLTGGILRCACGSAMLPRKGRAGVERERYVCRGRIEQGPDFCSQPSIRRGHVDAPLLATLLDGYIDIEATRRRIEDRAATALGAAREALSERETDVVRIESALATTERDYDAGEITGRQYGAREARLTAELAGARATVGHAQSHLKQVTEGIVPGDDAERTLLERLARLKQAVGDDLGAAPDLGALRNVIADLFASVELAPNPDGTVLLLPTLRIAQLADGRWDFDSAGRPQALPMSLPAEGEAMIPTGQATPVPCAGYPPGFFARYC